MRALRVILFALVGAFFLSPQAANAAKVFTLEQTLAEPLRYILFSQRKLPGSLFCVRDRKYRHITPYLVISGTRNKLFVSEIVRNSPKQRDRYRRQRVKCARTFRSFDVPPSPAPQSGPTVAPTAAATWGPKPDIPSTPTPIVSATSTPTLAPTAPSGIVTIRGWEIAVPNPDYMEVAEAAGSGDSRLVLDIFLAHSNFDSVSLSFKQRQRNAPQEIAIESEYILNNSGGDWHGYEFSLVPLDEGSMTFSRDSSRFSVSPFSNAILSSTPLTLTCYDSEVSLRSGDYWFPGIVRGSLSIQMNSGGGNSGFSSNSFLLRQRPLP